MLAVSMEEGGKRGVHCNVWVLFLSFELFFSETLLVHREVVRLEQRTGGTFRELLRLPARGHVGCMCLYVHVISSSL